VFLKQKGGLFRAHPFYNAWDLARLYARKPVFASGFWQKTAKNWKNKGKKAKFSGFWRLIP
jgi:hypothetical protein